MTNPVATSLVFDGPIIVLVLGGYGGFGGRISRRLAAAGYEVLVAGRDIMRARDFCGDNPLLTPIGVDRTKVRLALAEHKPAILVDASGPFQAMDYEVPRACIDAGIHYLDIADARAFVCGIGRLNVIAEAAGVIILSGASSVPCLSGAVVRHLAADMAKVDAIEMAISASNRAAAGPAVAASILGQVGQAMQIYQGKRWITRHGWQGLIRHHFLVKGRVPIANRWVGLVDVPDLALLPDRLPGRPTVEFRAGTELAFQNAGLWLASWLVRWRLIGSLKGLASWLEPLQRLTAFVGSDRSAMIVTVFGRVGARRVKRRWTLIAEEGDGPEIPSLSIVPLVKRILDGGEPPGARDAGNALTLADYQSAFNALAITHQVLERNLSPCLYARVMGGRFAMLPPAVQKMHDILRDGGAHGSAIVTGAANPFAAFVARIVGFPSAGTHDLLVSFSECDGVETWVRDFGGERFGSRLEMGRSLLVERFGPFRFGFDLPSDMTGLTMVMRRWWLGPFRLPLALAPRSLAREWDEDGVFHFDVPISVPLLGKLVHYRGWLKAVNSDVSVGDQDHCHALVVCFPA